MQDSLTLTLTILVIILVVLCFVIVYNSKQLKRNLLIKFKDKETSLNEQWLTKELFYKEQIEDLTTSIKDYKAQFEIKSTKYIQENKELAVKLASLETENFNLQDSVDKQKEEYRDLDKRFKEQFENLASKIAYDNSKKFAEQNKTNLEGVLNPLKEKLIEFEHKIEHSHKESLEKNASLKQQIESLSKLNEQITKEAHNLTKALKGDSKLQGNWGELVLERVLEKSGLEKGREYFVQQSFINDEGNKVIPDVVIHLPEGKKMIIDSKVSLLDYERYIGEEVDDLKEGHLKNHVFSIKRHIEQLSSKKYETLLDETPDFVLLFIPMEPAFAVALNFDAQLYNKAFEKNIVIVTPTTLLATLRTIDSMWNNEKQQRNAIEIAKKAAALYDKFSNLLSDFEKVGKQVGTLEKSYQDAMRKLTGKGNLVRQVEELKSLGVKATKQINEKWIKKEGNGSINE